MITLAEIAAPKKFHRHVVALLGNVKDFDNNNCRIKAQSRLMDMVLYTENPDAPLEARQQVKAAVGTIVDLCRVPEPNRSQH